MRKPQPIQVRYPIILVVDSLSMLMDAQETETANTQQEIVP
jgi:hypothetical protein